MEFTARDRAILSALKDARLTYQDLDQVLEFYQRLFLLQFAFKSSLHASGKAAYWVGKKIELSDVLAGRPQVEFDELGIEAGPALELHREIAQLLIPYVGTADGLEEEPVPEMLLDRARKIYLGRGPLVSGGDETDTVRAITGLVLAPYLYLASELILQKIPLEMWHRGCCPVCGGSPAFAALTSAVSPRTLFCPRCHAEWSFRRIGCPFCASKEPQIYYPGGEGPYRLYVCEECNRYLKTVDRRDGGPERCLPVESLVTVSMDLAAREKGFTA
jgi:hypothetical protein